MIQKSIHLILVLPLLFTLFTASVFAQENPNNVRSYNRVELSRNETIENDYFASGDTVIVSGTINGDAYIAGGQVIFDGTITGDLIAAGGEVVIRGTIGEDLRVAGGDVTVSADIAENVTVLGGNLTITENAVIPGSLTGAGGNIEVLAPIGRGITAGAGQLIIANTVGGDVKAGVGNLVLLSDAAIAGDVIYYSDAHLEQAQSASVSGTIVRKTPPANIDPEEARNALTGLATGVSLTLKAMSFISALVIGILIIWLAPLWMSQTSQTLSTRLGWSILAGFLFLILTPIAGIILFVTILGIPLGILLFVLYLTIMYLAKIFVAMAIGYKIQDWRNIKKPSLALTFVIGLIIYYILTWIPIIGWIIGFVGMLAGTGALLLTKRDYYAKLRSKKLL